MPRLPRRAGAAVSACLVLLLATGCGDDGDDDAAATTTSETSEPSTTTTVAAVDDDDPLNGFVPEPLQWDECGGGLQCASLEVPLDWDDPTGDTIDLAVTRLPGSGDDPLGAVATNPGGPGASGNQFILGGVFDDAVSDRFDTLSWDPRGVGGSAPLGCAGEEVDAFLRLDSGPDDAGEQAALDAGAQAVVDRCEREAGELLPFVGTGSVARDLEAIRLAYGEPMSYVGFSYGTAIGLQYLDLFPGNMPVVLDGVVDPEHTLTDLLRGQTEAFDRVVDEMFASCPAGQEGCPSGGASVAYDELAAEVEVTPIDADDDVLGRADLDTATILATYDRSFWEVLFAAYELAQDGDGSSLLELADLYRSSGAYDLYQAVSCLDSVNPSGSSGWAGFSDELEAISPRFGASVANEMLPCAFWPVPPVPVTGPVVAEGSGPVLVIGSTGDAATPIEQAERVAANLAEGHLVVREGEGHTAYGSSGCVRDIVADFLIDGTVPADGTRCPS
jgi:pimeloyl-ACP methyl ester carboxylesterase